MVKSVLFVVMGVTTGGSGLFFPFVSFVLFFSGVDDWGGLFQCVLKPFTCNCGCHQGICLGLTRNCSLAIPIPLESLRGLHFLGLGATSGLGGEGAGGFWVGVGSFWLLVFGWNNHIGNKLCLFNIHTREGIVGGRKREYVGFF